MQQTTEMRQSTEKRKAKKTDIQTIIVTMMMLRKKIQN